jgi:uncharacterized protein YegP (UPF0339 family)
MGEYNGGSFAYEMRRSDEASWFAELRGGNGKVIFDSEGKA